MEHSEQTSTDTTTSTSSSVVNFKFPVPATDSAHSWDSETYTIMAPSECETESSLGDSTYEFLDTDGETDGHDEAAGSVASADYDDGVASLGEDTESGDSDEEVDEDSPDRIDTADSSYPLYPESDHSPEFDVETPSGSRNSMVFEDNEIPLTQHIEFKEEFDALDTEVTVKHTVRDLSEVEMAATAQQIKLPQVPERMAITIRQTMTTKQGLSAKVPLRILYGGSHAAKQDIILKVASSVTATVGRERHGHNLRNSSSQLYNVIPVSAFGSEEIPEIELMQSSGYSIKVEDCVSAKVIDTNNPSGTTDEIELIVNDNQSYTSFRNGNEYFVDPQWDLPHVCIVYYSETDDNEAKMTMSLMKKFMNRHEIPCIAISHQQLFERGVYMSLDPNSIHMCLESRDPETGREVVHRRLPIDLSSFLNIDARQMNRNLAYLTKLYEPSTTASLTNSSKEVDFAAMVEKSEKSLSLRGVTRKAMETIRVRNLAQRRGIIPVGILLMSILLTSLFARIPSYGSSSPQAIQVNSKVISAMSISSSSTLVVPTVAKTTAAPTQAVLNTSTKTVTVTKSASSVPNALSVVPSTEVGKLFQPTPSKHTNKSPICSAVIIGHKEILIRIPTATKLSWLSKEGLSVNITRGETVVDTERAYSTSEGVVLLLPQAQAHGRLNISIVSSRKPRVNESFEVDFGTTFAQILIDKYSALFVEGRGYSAEEIITHLEKFAQDTRENSQTTLTKLREINDIARQQACKGRARMTEFFKSAASDAAHLRSVLAKDISAHLDDAEITLSKQLDSLKNLQEPLETGLLKAQVASRLLWLKMQGKHDEHEQYKKRAERATSSMRSEGTTRGKFSKKNCWKAKAQRDLEDRQEKKKKKVKKTVKPLAARTKGRGKKVRT